MEFAALISHVCCSICNPSDIRVACVARLAGVRVLITCVLALCSPFCKHSPNITVVAILIQTREKFFSEFAYLPCFCFCYYVLLCARPVNSYRAAHDNVTCCEECRYFEAPCYTKGHRQICIPCHHIRSTSQHIINTECLFGSVPSVVCYA